MLKLCRQCFIPRIEVWQKLQIPVAFQIAIDFSSASLTFLLCVVRASSSLRSRATSTEYTSPETNKATQHNGEDGNQWRKRAQITIKLGLKLCILAQRLLQSATRSTELSTYILLLTWEKIFEESLQRWS
jgi:hypothetical protein